MEEEFQQHLLATFQIEAREHVVAMSAGLDRLKHQAAPDFSRHLEGIFRHAHSLKGAARSVGAGDIAVICQSLENVFARLKINPGPVSEGLFDGLQRAIDRLSDLIPCGRLAPEELTDLERGLNQCLAEITRSSLKSPPSNGSEAEPRHIRGGPKLEPEIPGIVRADLAETVRVSSAKLESILFQAEELVAANLSAAQRAREIDQLREQIETWRRHLQDSTRWQRTLEVPGVEAPGGGARHSRAAEYVDHASLEFVRSVEHKLSLLTQRAARDDRVLAALIDRLLESTKDTLMLQFASLFELLPRVVRELGGTLQKEVELRIEGADVEVDRRILQELKDPVLHLVRNSMAHGFEPVAERQTTGKPERGTLLVAAAQKSGGRVEVIVSDDGQGIDLDALRRAAAAAEIRSEEQIARMSEGELLDLVFESGLSTAPHTSDVAGRGLGLAIVREKVEKLGGSIRLENSLGRGLSIRMNVPSALTRFRGVLVTSASQLFVLPSALLQRALRVDPKEIQSVEGRQTLCIEHRVVPLVALSDVLGMAHVPSSTLTGSKSPGARISALVLERHNRRIAFVVDEIHLEQEILMKSLGPQLRRVRHVAGACVLGDGTLVPVLNADDLLKSALKTRPESMASASVPNAGPGPKSILVAEDSITSRTFLRSILQRAGYEVETAVDGAAALHRLQSRRFDLLVSDVDMPRLNGVELTARVRSSPELANLPVVLVTGLSSRTDQERGLQAGANAYVVKSNFEQSNLLSVVSGLLS